MDCRVVCQVLAGDWVRMLSKLPLSFLPLSPPTSPGFCTPRAPCHSFLRCSRYDLQASTSTFTCLLPSLLLSLASLLHFDRFPQGSPRCPSHVPGALTRPLRNHSIATLLFPRWYAGWPSALPSTGRSNCHARRRLRLLPRLRRRARSGLRWPSRPSRMRHGIRRARLGPLRRRRQSLLWSCPLPLQSRRMSSTVQALVRAQGRWRIFQHALLALHGQRRGVPRPGLPSAGRSGRRLRLRGRVRPRLPPAGYL